MDRKTKTRRTGTNRQCGPQHRLAARHQPGRQTRVQVRHPGLPRRHPRRWSAGRTCRATTITAARPTTTARTTARHQPALATCRRRRDRWPNGVCAVAPPASRRTRPSSWRRCPCVDLICSATLRSPKASTSAPSVPNSISKKLSRTSTASSDTHSFTTRATSGRSSPVPSAAKSSPDQTRWRTTWKLSMIASCPRTVSCLLAFISHLRNIRSFCVNISPVELNKY